MVKEKKSPNLIPTYKKEKLIMMKKIDLDMGDRNPICMPSSLKEARRFCTEPHK